ncbi:hypothetical protein NP493_183g01017 [Ridgeia piscesae]|uniref:Extracellular globin n=1 Tax=Ridgeia piscesae TaxID=27915 RepID=A0AAD9P2I6_RIDPI|nr:hypothetical protein NP493_183g01017 [Ridgeia piscesae]
MRRLAPLLLVLCGAATALGRMWCSRTDANDVIFAWSQAFGAGSNQDTGSVIRGGTGFFIRLMQEAPATRALFSRVNVDDVHSPEFGAHVLRVITGLDLCVNALQDYPVLKEITSHLAEQHARIPGVKAEYFEMLLNGMGRAFPMVVDKFNIDAWTDCMTPVVRAITARLP